MLLMVELVQAGFDFKLVVEWEAAQMGKVVDLTAIEEEKKVSLNL
jgi:hypothetical protein